MRRDTYEWAWCFAGWRTNSKSEDDCEQHNVTENLRDERKSMVALYKPFKFGFSPA
jgi:hypothetical protein